MPSASAKVNTTTSQQQTKEMDLKSMSSTPPIDPCEAFRQAVTMIEHKIRNMEKRKGKLDAYKSEQDQGKVLNADQLAAVSKYGEVLQTLDFARDLIKHINQIQNDTSRLFKKQQKKEQLEKAAAEMERSKLSLILFNSLQQLTIPRVREDFASGKNGAIMIGAEELKAVDELSVISGLKFKQENSNEQLDKATEHLVNLIDGKSKPVCGSSGKTYKEIHELLTSVANSDYFQKARENGARNEAHNDSEHTEEVLSTGNESAQIPQETTKYPFAKEPQVDIQSPHMDPAVVAVSSYAPPQPQMGSQARGPQQQQQQVRAHHQSVLVQTMPHTHNQNQTVQHPPQQVHQQVQHNAPELVQISYTSSTTGATDPLINMNHGMGDLNLNHAQDCGEIDEWNPNPEDKSVQTSKYRRTSGHNSDNAEEYGIGDYYDPGMNSRGNNNWDPNSTGDNSRGYRGRGGERSGGRGRTNGFNRGGNRTMGSSNRWTGPPNDRYENEPRNYPDREYKPRGGRGGPQGGSGGGRGGSGGSNYYGGGGGSGYRRPYRGGYVAPDSQNAY